MSNRANMTFEEARATLGVSTGASRLELKKAFAKLALKHHPDKASSSTQPHEKFIQIRECYDLLFAVSEEGSDSTTASHTSVPQSVAQYNNNNLLRSFDPSSGPTPPRRPAFYSSFNPPPKIQAAASKGELNQIRCILNDLSEQHSTLLQLVEQWFRENFVPGSKESNTASMFTSVYKIVGVSLRDALIRLQNLPAGDYGCQMVKDLHGFATETERFFSLVRLILKKNPKEGTEEIKQDDANRKKTKPGLELEMLITLATAPQPPVYYNPPPTLW
ncbi:hypothetical protein SUNI508_06973 [Seiridium unicorne]|uniref:J domain-containing protein n=1 Tax=Seiridium unicorne TaxID=138068 RepID=A0ABR2UZG7_9PEZI